MEGVPAKEHSKSIRVVYWRSSRSRHRPVEMPGRREPTPSGTSWGDAATGWQPDAEDSPHAVRSRAPRIHQRDGYPVTAGVAVQPPPIGVCAAIGRASELGAQVTVRAVYVSAASVVPRPGPRNRIVSGGRVSLPVKFCSQIERTNRASEGCGNAREHPPLPRIARETPVPSPPVWTGVFYLGSGRSTHHLWRIDARRDARLASRPEVANAVSTRREPLHATVARPGVLPIAPKQRAWGHCSTASSAPPSSDSSASSSMNGACNLGMASPPFDS
jgi:hypothetical protein